MKIASFLTKYFWDIDFKSLSAKDSVFIIERILEYGDEKAIRWMMRNFDRSQIKKVLLSKRGFSKKQK